MRVRICAGRGLFMEHPVMAACWVPQVYRGLLNHVQPVAVKVIPAGIVGSAPRASVETIREITLLRQCRCPHIVQARRECLVPAHAVAIAPLLALCCGGVRVRLVFTSVVHHGIPHHGLLPLVTVHPQRFLFLTFTQWRPCELG